MENNPLRGLFGVSSPRLEPQLATPQPTAHTENIEYEILDELETRNIFSHSKIKELQ